jgi:DNA-binding NarL/FixJ family response regulator
METDGFRGEAMIRIFIVDDHPVMRKVLRSLLEREPDLTVCGEAATAQAALVHADQSEPDLVLIDVSLPGMSGIELARELKARHPNLPLAMFSGHNTESHVDQAFQAGVSGYILKERANELPLAIRQIMRGERYLSPEVEFRLGDG